MKNALSDYYGFRRALRRAIFHFGAIFGGNYVETISCSPFSVPTHVGARLPRTGEGAESRNDPPYCRELSAQ